MSDYESGSPPSREEMDNSNSMGMYSNISSVQKPETFSMMSSSMPTRINGTNTHVNSKRYSMGKPSSFDSDYQINEELSNSVYRRSSKRPNFNQICDLPDLRPNMNTKFSSNNFASCIPRQSDYEHGYDFGEQYKQLFEEHKDSNEQASKIELNAGQYVISSDKTCQQAYEVSSIWCMDYQENLIVTGCANGSLEFWEGTTGKFKV